MSATASPHLVVAQVEPLQNTVCRSLLAVAPTVTAPILGVVIVLPLLAMGGGNLDPPADPRAEARSLFRRWENLDTLSLRRPTAPAARGKPRARRLGRRMAWPVVRRRARRATGSRTSDPGRSSPPAPRCRAHMTTWPALTPVRGALRETGLYIYAVMRGLRGRIDATERVNARPSHLLTTDLCRQFVDRHGLDRLDD